MKYTVVVKDIQNLRNIQDIITENDKSAELFLECDSSRALKSRRMREADIVLVEAVTGLEDVLEYLADHVWEPGRPEIILIMGCLNNSILHKIEKLSYVYLMNNPFERWL